MALGAYLRFAAANRGFVSFGFLVALGSSFGQTFFIGVFGPTLQAEFGLSHTAWSGTYMAGTLASAAVLPWSGRLIDRLDLRTFAVGVCGLLALACTFTAAVQEAAWLVVAIFLLRHAGQGLMSHVAVTSMARYFEVGRGRAIAIATLGFAAGEAVLPVLAVASIAAIGWRATYACGGLAIVLILVPTVWRLLRDHGERHRAHRARLVAAGTAAAPGRRSWTRAEMLRDRRFYLLLPGLLAPSVVVTGMFFYNLALADAKGWSHAWMTGSYAVFAAATVGVSLVSGPLIDRFGAVRLLPFMLLPLAAGLAVVALRDGAAAVWLYLALMGITTGISHTAVTAMWAELYGVAHLGAIRSLAAALSVLGSAIGPVAMGVGMDRGMPIEEVCLMFAGYCAAGAVLVAVALSDTRG